MSCSLPTCDDGTGSGSIYYKSICKNMRLDAETGGKDPGQEADITDMEQAVYVA